jgi:hypothetical protein
MTMRQAGFMMVMLLVGAGRALAADDFVEQCKKGEIGDAEKVCRCISDKIGTSDRAGALALMRKINDAADSGQQVDPAGVTAEMRAGLQAVVELEGQCTQ